MLKFYLSDRSSDCLTDTTPFAKNKIKEAVAGNHGIPANFSLEILSPQCLNFTEANKKTKQLTSYQLQTIKVRLHISYVFPLYGYRKTVQYNEGGAEVRKY